MRNNKGQFVKTPWYFRDSYGGKSPAEIVGTLVPLFSSAVFVAWLLW